MAAHTQAAASPVQSPAPFSRNCWDLAAYRFGVDAWLLLALAKKESELTPGALGRNKDGTEDLGIMQINSRNLKEMEAYGVSRHDLLHNNCKGIYVAAYLLNRCIARYGNNIDGVGCYHSRTPTLRRKYGQAVWKIYDELVAKHYVRREPFRLNRAAGH